jgi:hypothetical protein
LAKTGELKLAIDNEGDRRLGGVEPGSAVDRHPDAPIQGLVTGVVHAKASRSEHARTMLADCLGQRGQSLETAA